MVANLDVDSISIEGDSKTCIDVLRYPNQDVPWRIKTICSNVLALKLNFSNCSFSWVAREANVAAHVLAKWSCQTTTLALLMWGWGLLAWFLLLELRLFPCLCSFVAGLINLLVHQKTIKVRD